LAEPRTNPLRVRGGNDQADNREWRSKLLASIGFTVKEATGGGARHSRVADVAAAIDP